MTEINQAAKDFLENPKPFLGKEARELAEIDGKNEKPPASVAKPSTPAPVSAGQVTTKNDYSRENVLKILTLYLEWISSDDTGWAAVDFLRSQGLYATFFHYAKVKNSEDDEVQQLFQACDVAYTEKIVWLAARKRIDTTFAIFLLKAKFGWRDGAEQKPVQSLTLAYQGLTEGELQKQIEKFMGAMDNNKKLSQSPIDWDKVEKGE